MIASFTPSWQLLCSPIFYVWEERSENFYLPSNKMKRLLRDLLPHSNCHILSREHKEVGANWGCNSTWCFLRSYLRFCGSVPANSHTGCGSWKSLVPSCIPLHTQNKTSDWNWTSIFKAFSFRKGISTHQVTNWRGQDTNDLGNYFKDMVPTLNIFILHDKI